MSLPPNCQAPVFDSSRNWNLAVLHCLLSEDSDACRVGVCLAARDNISLTLQLTDDSTTVKILLMRMIRQTVSDAERVASEKPCVFCVEYEALNGVSKRNGQRGVAAKTVSCTRVLRT